jgi:serine/threonine-protein kinase
MSANPSRSTGRSNRAPLPREAWARLERVLERFEDAWRRGQRPDLDPYLAEAEPGERQALLVELIHTDLHYRLQAGELARTEDYLARYRELAADQQAVLELIMAEYQMRREHEPGLATREYLHRFPQHAEVLQARLALNGGDRLSGRAAADPPARLAETPLQPSRESLRGSSPEQSPGSSAIPATNPGSADPSTARAGDPSTIPGYEILGELGRGGMGVVLHGRDPGLGRDLAVKVLRPDHQGDPELYGRFIEEAQIAGQLQHPGIAPVYARGQCPDGRPFFTMKLVQGQTLTDLLAARSDPAQDLPRVLSIFEAVCQTLAYAHSKGVIHRDLKPSNIMVGSFGEVQVMDWGLAKVLPAHRQAGQPAETEVREPVSAVRTLRSETAGLSSQAGAVLGTPAYMAPEQALGQVDRLDERADVFGLGAILCEILTGQPPYPRAGEHVHLPAVRGELIQAWSRLDGCGSDPELVRLAKACLAANVDDRPRNAGKVAKAVAGYLAGVQQRLQTVELQRAAAQARAEEVSAKVAAERRARQRLLGLAVSVLLLVGGSSFGAWRWHDQRLVAQARQQQTEQEVRAVLVGARALLDEGWEVQDEAKLRDAKAEGERAGDIARTGAANIALQQDAAEFQTEAEKRLERCQNNAALRRSLLDVSAPPEVRSYISNEVGRMVARAQLSVDEQYAAAFRRWGLDVDGLAESEVIARLRQEPDLVVREVIAGLDAWRLERWRQQSTETRWHRLDRVTEELDDDATRRQLQALLVEGPPPRAETVAGLLGETVPWPALWVLARGENWRRVQELRGRMNPGREPVLTVVVLAQAYRRAGDTAGAVEVLRQAIAVRPDQLVLLRMLAGLLEQQGRWEEAIGCYRAIRVQHPRLGAALARALIQVGRADEGETVLRELIRQQPSNPELLLYLAFILEVLKKQDEAERVCRQAISLDPNLAQAYYNLGAILWGRKRPEEAVAAFRQAILRKPDFVKAYDTLAVALLGQKKPAEAVTVCHQAILRDRGYAGVYNTLGVALNELKKPVEAEAAWREALALDPDFVLPYINRSNALRERKKPGEAEAASRAAIALQPNNAEAYQALGLALGDQNKPAEAEAAIRKAIELEPGNAQMHYNLGVALGDQTKLAEAEAAFLQATVLDPDFALAHLNLGFAWMQQARFDKALGALKKGSRLLPLWDPQRVRAWQLLRRCERQAVLDARLPGLLAGTDRPANQAERLEFAQVCGLKQRFAAAAALYAEAFAAQPRLAADLGAEHRYAAACYAARAGAGQGTDAVGLSAGEQLRWRRQALTWLRDDLAAWDRQLQGKPATGPGIRQTLRHWMSDPDLAVLRDPGALPLLPAEERAACQRLWIDVADLLKRTEPKGSPAAKEGPATPPAPTPGSSGGTPHRR